MFGLPWLSQWTTNVSSMLSYVTWYCCMRFLSAMMLVIMLFLNQTGLWYPGTCACSITIMVPPLLHRCMLLLALKLFLMRAWLQNKSIIDWLSRRIISLRSKSMDLAPCDCLKSSVMHGSKTFSSCANWKAWVWKWESSSSASDLETSELTSCSLVSCMFIIENFFFISLRSLVSFFMLLAELARDLSSSSSSLSFLGQCKAGWPCLSHL